MSPGPSPLQTLHQTLFFWTLDLLLLLQCVIDLLSELWKGDQLVPYEVKIYLPITPALATTKKFYCILYGSCVLCLLRECQWNRNITTGTKAWDNSSPSSQKSWQSYHLLVSGAPAAFFQLRQLQLQEHWWWVNQIYPLLPQNWRL